MSKNTKGYRITQSGLISGTLEREGYRELSVCYNQQNGNLELRTGVNVILLTFDEGCKLEEMLTEILDRAEALNRDNKSITT